MVNSFVAADWGTTYDWTDYNNLGDLLEWDTHEPKVGMVVIDTDGNLSKALDDATLRMAHGGNPPLITTIEQPLLPSPKGLTRAVAIASLERAGFKRGMTQWYVEICALIGISFISDCDEPECWRIWIDMDEADDPVLAQYAVDCFRVLKQWADDVDWKN